MEGVCNIERLGPKFRLLSLTELKRLRESRIELPGAGAANAARAGISQRASAGSVNAKGLR